MPLLTKDIERIKRLDRKEEHFVITNDGWLQLTNYDGKCVFHDGNQCMIYEKRPEGCTLYPIIYDEENNCAIIDKDCPHRNEFRITELKHAQLSSLITKLKDERRQRK
jgi:Fe-S-cluster containining protein